ncbi:tRNA pseudouridine(55) synthase TruB [Candidatus Dojkabacteria bacterium]|nr:tRNA pseudouridine(55) synthase TruB [Candidatus Dojkabacteria bacterium]
MGYEINKMTIGAGNQVHGVLAVNKPSGITSHDVVNIVRKKYNTRKVGHAGALDPFARGVLIVLIGRYTKLSDQLMGGDKEYKCKILLGLETDTLDTEGKIIKSQDVSAKEINEKISNGALAGIERGYDQQVPVFSSVKVEGQKLRILAHKSERYEIDGDAVIFYMNDDRKKRVVLPRKKVQFEKFEIGEKKEIRASEVERYLKGKKNFDGKTRLVELDLTVGCSKGTYIRQLAKDIGELLEVPAMLIELERSRVGQITLAECISINDLK